MTKFVIRDSNGTAKARVDARVMAAITSSGGAWRTYVANNQNSVCYEYFEDMKFDLTSFGIGIELYLWKGDKVIPVDRKAMLG